MVQRIDLNLEAQAQSTKSNREHNCGYLSSGLVPVERDLQTLLSPKGLYQKSESKSGNSKGEELKARDDDWWSCRRPV